MLRHKKIAILGTGNLGSSIIKGLIASGFEPGNIFATRRKTEQLKSFADAGVHVTSNNKEAVNGSDIIIISVKPFKINAILEEIESDIKSRHILISVVSGISIDKIKSRFNGTPVPVCRAMPNTAIAINESMTCIAAPETTEEQRKIIGGLFSGLGRSIFVNEEMMDASTVLAACGIAFAMRFIRAMMQGGIEIGFDSKTARDIVNQTVKGAAELLIRNELHPEEEIDKVTTPKGYTISGLNEMEHNGFSSSLIKGIITSFSKIQ